MVCPFGKAEINSIDPINDYYSTTFDKVDSKSTKGSFSAGTRLHDAKVTRLNATNNAKLILLIKNLIVLFPLSASMP